MTKVGASLESVFYALSIAVILIGGVMWLSAIDSKATTGATAALESQKQFEEIRIRLTHIEDALK